MITLGLRFKRGQRRQLKAIRDQAIAAGTDQIGLFDKALDSAMADEPLVVRCEHRGEVEDMAAAFTRLGMSRPSIEELSGY